MKVAGIFEISFYKMLYTKCNFLKGRTYFVESEKQFFMLICFLVSMLKIFIPKMHCRNIIGSNDIIRNGNYCCLAVSIDIFFLTG